MMLISLSSLSQTKQEIAKIANESKNGISTVYTDSKSAVATVYSDLKTSAPKVYKALESLAKELKTTTDALWIILVKQQLVWSICFLILTFTSILNWFLFYKRNLNIKLTENDFIVGQKDNVEIMNNPDYSAYGTGERGKTYLSINKGKEDILIPIENSTNNWFKYLHLTICLGLSGLSIYHFSDMLTGFINPEFGALKTITMVIQSFK